MSRSTSRAYARIAACGTGESWVFGGSCALSAHRLKASETSERIVSILSHSPGSTGRLLQRALMVLKAAQVDVVYKSDYCHVDRGLRSADTRHRAEAFGG